jgi:hypothetical protein
MNFAKYELTNHLQLTHERCNGVGLHCILQGVCGCDTTKDHNKQCPDCNKLLRSAHDLRLWLRKRHNELCQTFELVLPEWCARGSSLHDVERLTVPPPNRNVGLAAIGTPPDSNGGMAISTNVQDTVVQCEKCRTWFILPPNISVEDLPEVFKCTLRWWDLPLGNKPPQSDWCQSGQTNRRLVAQWMKILEERKEAEGTVTLLEEERPILEEEPNMTANETLSIEEEHPSIPVDTIPSLEQSSHASLRLLNHALQPEGAARQRNKELSDVCNFNLYLAQWYVSHVARGKLQRARITD